MAERSTPERATTDSATCREVAAASQGRISRDIWTLDEVIPSCPKAGQVVLERIMHRLEQCCSDSSDRFAVHLALEEGIVNAIKHGNKYDDQKHVHVSCRLLSNRVYVEIQDEGAGFNPDDVPDCTQEENLEAPSGRGIALIRCFMSNVEYRDGGRRLVMEKQFSS